MKKIIFTLSALTILSLVACKKDRTCTCKTTRTSPSGVVTTSTNVTTFNDTKKSEARLFCVGESFTESNGTKVDERCDLK